MIRSKIDPAMVKDIAWKDYVKLFGKDVQQAQDKGVEKVPLIMISDFTFACGEVHALMLLGKQSQMTKFYKSLKTDKTRKKLKDFSIGFCHFDRAEDGSSSMRMAIEGLGKPSKMKKNSKQLIKKLGLTVKDIIKGQYTEEVVQEIEADMPPSNPEKGAPSAPVQEQAEAFQQKEDSSNQQTLQARARAFLKANKAMTTTVIALLKASKEEVVTYTTPHINIAEEAFRTAANLVDIYQQQVEEGKDLAKTAKKITALKDSIVNKDLVNKYERIWKKVQEVYRRQMEGLEAPFKEKLARLQQLLNEIKEEAASQ